MALNANALTSVQRLADFLELGTITVGSSKETLLQRIINAVSQFVETYTGRTFKQTTYTNEEYDVGTKSEYLHLKNWPVSSTASFTLQERQSAENEDDWDTIDSEDYFVDYDSGVVELAQGLKFGRGPKRYRVTYTAGYNFDNSSTFLGDFLPDLEYVVWKLCATLYNRRRGGVGVESERLGDVSVTLTKNVFESEEVREILDKYSKEEVASTKTPVNT